MESRQVNDRLEALKWAEYVACYSPVVAKKVRKQTTDPEARIRVAAIKFFSACNGQFLPQAHDEIVAALRDKDPLVQLEAARAFGRMGPAAEANIRRIRAPGSGVDPAIGAIAAGHAGARDPETRRQLIFAIAQRPAFRKEANDILLRMTDAMTIDSINSTPVQTFEEILTALHNRSPLVQVKAARALAGLGPEAEADIRRIRASGSGVDPTLGAIAAAHAGARDPETCRLLVAGLDCHFPIRDGSPPCYQRWAEEELIAMGTSTVIVSNELARLLDKRKPLTSYPVFNVMNQTHALLPSSVPSLRRLLRERRSYDAARALGAIGPGAAAAVPDIIAWIHSVKHLGNTDMDYLVHIGTASVGPLVSMSREKDVNMREMALYALACLSDKDKRAARRLEEELQKDAPIGYYQFGLKGLGSRIRVLAKPLFQRMLRRNRLRRDEDYKLLRQALPIPAEELYTPKYSSEVAVTLSSPTHSIAAGESINLQLKIKNLKSQEIRLIDPRNHVNFEDPVDFIIFRDPGWPVFPAEPAIFSGMAFGSDENDSVVIRPGEESSLKRLLPPLWSDGPGDDSRWPKARAGRYRIRARYRFSGEDLKHTRFWNEDLARRFGHPWLGETISNEIVLDVASSGTVSSVKEIEWVTIPGGSFKMGAEEWSYTRPRHKVRVKTFQMSKTLEVIQ
jgi:HEAT repeat protein